MKLKLILVMAMTLISVFGAIYVSTIYTGFAAPYLIGIITPILISFVYNFELKNLKNVKNIVKTKK